MSTHYLKSLFTPDSIALFGASDLSGTAMVVLEAFASDEPDNAPGSGDGDTYDDIQDAITGTPDAVRDQLKQWDGLADEVILYPPSIGIAPGRVQENLDAMIETFASRT